MQWLPEDQYHPTRPDWPVFRHLTFTEVHAIELGAYLAVFVLFLQLGGFMGEAVAIAVTAARIVISDRKAKGGKTHAAHRVGLHDARAELHYFGTSSVVTYIVGYAVALALGLAPSMPMM